MTPNSFYRPFRRVVLPVLGMAAGFLLLLMALVPGTCLRPEDSSYDTKNMEKVVRLASTSIEAQLAGHENLSRVLAQILADPRVEAGDVRRLTRGIVATCPEVFGAVAGFEPYALNPRRKYVADYYYSAPGEIGHFDLSSVEKPYVQWPWYMAGKDAGSPVWTSPYVDEGSEGQRMVSCVVRIARDSGRERIGVLALDLSLSRLQHTISTLPLPRDGLAMILAKDGKVIAHTDTSLILKEPDSPNATFHRDEALTGILDRMRLGGSRLLELHSSSQAEERTLRFSTIGSTGWFLVVIHPRRDRSADGIPRLFCALAGLVLAGLALRNFRARIGSQLHVGTKDDALK